MVSATEMNVRPVTLRGRAVRLEPMSIDHVDGLARAGMDPELWRWIPTTVRTPEDMHAYVQTALEEFRRGVSLPFVIFDNASGQIIGSTRYGNIVPAHRRLEIGWT
jgi:N-acetyltransferase